MSGPSKPGSASKQQINRIFKAAASREHSPNARHLLALARAERNRNRDRAAIGPVVKLADLSMYEATSLITLLESGESLAVCDRCARLGFPVEHGALCMHDARPDPGLRRTIEIDRWNGVR